MNKSLDALDLQVLASDPVALAEFCREKRQSFKKVLLSAGLTEREADRLLVSYSAVGHAPEPGNSRQPFKRRATKFSKLVAARPTPMTDAEYAHVLRGKTRNGD